MCSSLLHIHKSIKKAGYIMFNSRNSIYKNPVGAVANNTKIHFKINPPKNIGCRGVYLIITSDTNKYVHDMFWCGDTDDGKEWWECHFTPTEIGAYFYSFELVTDHGRRTLYKDIGGNSTFNNTNNYWQITVYEEDFTTPNWLDGGVIYQIFPDRFAFSGDEKTDVPYGRTLRDDWGNTPQWQPNDQGEITNSDYFKGDLKGIEQKLPYLNSLGVTCVYLNPIFEAHSNHRYNTGDYSKIDPLLGDQKDFEELCNSAENFGIKVILDGVFSHTGSDSVYFNRENRYETLGAYNSKESPYYPWYSFRNWNNDYECWWNFITLPNVKENNPEYSNYITGENGIIEKWINKGSCGWRLDVADELPDEILDKIYARTKATNKDAIVMGEVWEDASTKTAYGVRRRYLLGKQMDTVMNYPFRDAILRFLTGDHSSICMEIIESICENYPPQCLKLLMNHIGTHDTERAITILAGEPHYNRDRAWQNQTHLSPEQWQVGVKKLKLASLLQFTLPGVPSIYYGDEAGMEGYRDPFNRGCYPWGNENMELLEWYKTLGKMRKDFDVFKNGSIRNIYSHKEIMCFERYTKEQSVVIAVNRSDTVQTIPEKITVRKTYLGENIGNQTLTLPPFGFAVLS